MKNQTLQSSKIKNELKNRAVDYSLHTKCDLRKKSNICANSWLKKVVSIRVRLCRECVCGRERGISRGTLPDFPLSPMTSRSDQRASFFFAENLLNASHRILMEPIFIWLTPIKRFGIEIM